MADRPRCETCWHWHEWGVNPTGDRVGECRCRAPRPRLLTPKEARKKAWKAPLPVIWPVTGRAEVCGEWAPHPVGNVPVLPKDELPKEAPRG